MKKKDLKDMNKGDMNKKLTELRKELHDFRFGKSGGKAKNVKTARNTRRDIARVLTALNK